MGRRKINYEILLSIILIFFSFASSQVFAEECKIVNIRVDKWSSINDYFYGFGVETLPWLWTKENKEAGINKEDIRLNLERIKDMHLPITRIFVPWETWNPSVDYKTFTWESDEMRSLYKTLDIYQEIGTSVIIVTVDWLKDSPWKDAKASAKAVLRLLEYLIKEKGYSCIQFWTLTNEPELTYGWRRKMPFENYVQIHQLVKEGLKKKKIPVKIIASDEVESQEWFKSSVQSLYKVTDIFSSHLYLYPQQIHLIPEFFRERLNIIKKASLAKRDIPFFLCEFGFRGSDFGTCTNSLIESYEYGLYVANLCIEALNSGIDAASIWCLYQIRLIDEINPEGGKVMRIGLWGYKDEGWQPKPVFYIYSLFTKYLKKGSKVLKTESQHSLQVKAACVESEGKIFLFVINVTQAPLIIKVTGLEHCQEIQRYLYSRRTILIKESQMLKPDKQINVADFFIDIIPASSVVLYTNNIK